MPLRHAAPHRFLTRCICSFAARPPAYHRAHHRFLTRFPIWTRFYQHGKLEQCRDFTQEADLVRGSFGAHGGHETAQVRDFRGIGGRRGLCGRPGKRLDGAFPGRPRSFRHQRRPMGDCSPGRGGIVQNGGTRGGTFHEEMDR